MKYIACFVYVLNLYHKIKFINNLCSPVFFSSYPAGDRKLFVIGLLLLLSCDMLSLGHIAQNHFILRQHQPNKTSNLLEQKVLFLCGWPPNAILCNDCVVATTTINGTPIQVHNAIGCCVRSG